MGRGMSRAIVFDSESPAIIELRKEFKKAMIEGQKHRELIHEKLKASAEVLSYGEEKE